MEYSRFTEFLRAFPFFVLYSWKFSGLLNSLTQNKYTVEYSFGAANTINQILPDVHYYDEYVFVSLDVVSLMYHFANENC